MELTGRIRRGMTIKHFKRDAYLASLDHKPDSNEQKTYLYRVEYISTHTETKEKLVSYTALYSNEKLGVEVGDVFSRPYDMFMSEVDHEKYPDVKQLYRFEEYK